MAGQVGAARYKAFNAHELVGAGRTRKDAASGRGELNLARRGEPAKEMTGEDEEADRRGPLGSETERSGSGAEDQRSVAVRF